MFQILTPAGRMRLCGLGLLTFLSALMETAGIAGWIPFVSFATNPGVVDQNLWMNRIHQLGGFRDYPSFLQFLGICLLFLFLVGNVCRGATTWLCYRFSWGENHRLSHLLLDRYLHKPYVWFLNQNSSDLAKNVVEEVGNAVENVIQRLCMLMVRGGLALLICLGLLLADPQVAVTTSVFLVLVYTLFYRFFRGSLTRSGRMRLESNRLRYKAVLEALSAVKEAKALGGRDHFLEVYRRHSRSTNELRVQSELIGDLPGHLTEAVAMGGMLAVMVYLLISADGYKSALPMIALYIVATIRLTPALQDVYNNVVRIRFFLPSLEKIHEEISCGDSGTHAEAAQVRLEFRHSLRLEGVGYSYPDSGHQALSEVDVEFFRNTSTALVGKTGAGKSTLADIAAGLLTPSQGTVKVDGMPLTSKRTLRWQRCVGYVPQEIYLLDDTLRRNIAFGIAPNQVDDMALVRAAKAANIHEFIVKELEKGYDTVLGERGIRLSGGQRQRIGIARSLYPDPDVLIFDEATSSLDNLTERAVMEAIQQLSHRKTLIVIAHRLSTVKMCDSICFLEKGRVGARGSFDELARSCPAFRELAQTDLSTPSARSRFARSA